MDLKTVSNNVLLGQIQAQERKKKEGKKYDPEYLVALYKERDRRK